MKEAPRAFTRQLEQAFDGRLRIRWSVKQGEWQIEQKVGRASLPPIRVSEVDDDLIRAKDGYAYVLSVRSGTTMPCPKCGLDVKVPALRFAETTCDYCRFKGRDGTIPAAYFPLSDLLIDHLKKIAPERQTKALLQGLDARNDAILKSRQREVENNGEAAIKDHWKQIAQIPHVGYTGKEFKGAA